MKKRIISVVLVVLMLITMIPLAALAEDVTPIIVVGGYSSSQIYLFNDDGTIKEKVWTLNMSDVLKKAFSDIPGLTEANIKQYIEKEDPDAIVKQVGPVIEKIFENMRRNADGTPAHNTGTWPKSAAESNMKYIEENRDTNEYIAKTIREKRYSPVLAEMLGGENVFNFSVDWRQSNINCAFDLGKYIVDVLEYSGKNKVSIFCESHGAETTSTYISLCSIVAKGGADAEKLAALLGAEMSELQKYFNLDYIKNAVLDSPAIGVQLAYDLVTGKFNFDIPEIVEYVEFANNPLQIVAGGSEYVWESDYEWLLSCLTLEKINAFLSKLIHQTGIIDILLSFGSIWDFMPAAHYDEVKAMKLDTAEKQAAYAPTIEKSDYLHYVVMANENENLTYAREHGVNVNIIAGTDIKTCTGSKVSGDALVAVTDSTGAKVCDYGTRFNDGYKTDYTDEAVTCTNSTHDHVAPSMKYDAAYGYLPENTWYIEGQFHAQYIMDDYCHALCDFLLLADEPVDIYSNPDFPQFEINYNAKNGIHAEFDNSVYGVLTAENKALEVKNLSAKSNIEIVAVKVEGADIDFGKVFGEKIKVGGTVSIPFTGEVPDADMKNVTISIYYLEDSSPFSMNGRTFNFKVKGGAATEYDSENPFVKAYVKPTYLSVSDIMNGLNNFSYAAKLKAIILSVLSGFKAIMNVFNGIKNK